MFFKIIWVFLRLTILSFLLKYFDLIDVPYGCLMTLIFWIYRIYFFIKVWLFSFAPCLILKYKFPNVAIVAEWLLGYEAADYFRRIFSSPTKRVQLSDFSV